MYQTKQIVNEIINGLFCRGAQNSEIDVYSKMLEQGQSISRIIQVLKSKPEFYSKVFDVTHHLFKLTNKFENIEKNPEFVFIHIPKTGGQSLYFLLKKFCRNKTISPLFQELMYKPISFVYNYDILFGHTDYETVKTFVFNKKSKYIVFLRDPIKRLISLYYFWWLHNPADYPKNYAVTLANSYSIEEFFEDSYIKEVLWNDMFGRFIGYKTLESIKEEYLAIKKKKRKTFIKEVISPLIEERFNSYFFVGLQENFDIDTSVLFDKMNIKIEENIIKRTKINTLEELKSKNGYKNTSPVFRVTPEVLKRIKSLVELDLFLYEYILKKRKEKRGAE